MNDDDNDDQMIFGNLVGLKLSDICLTGEENPEKTSPRRLAPTGDRTRALCVTGAHATTWPTAVCLMILNKFIRFISRNKTRYISCTHYPILHFLGSILYVLQHRLLHKTQVNSLRTEKILVGAPHKAVERPSMFNGS